MILEETSHRMMHFSINHLKKKQPRDDYFELLKLSFASYKNSTSRCEVSCTWVCAPRSTIALKIRMFQKQFSLSAQEEEALKELYVFAIIY